MVRQVEGDKGKSTIDALSEELYKEASEYFGIPLDKIKPVEVKTPKEFEDYLDRKFREFIQSYKEMPIMSKIRALFPYLLINILARFSNRDIKKEIKKIEERKISGTYFYLNLSYKNLKFEVPPCIIVPENPTRGTPFHEMGHHIPESFRSNLHPAISEAYAYALMEYSYCGSRCSDGMSIFSRIGEAVLKGKSIKKACEYVAEQDVKEGRAMVSRSDTIPPEILEKIMYIGKQERIPQDKIKSLEEKGYTELRISSENTEDKKLDLPPKEYKKLVKDVAESYEILLRANGLSSSKNHLIGLTIYEKIKSKYRENTGKVLGHALFNENVDFSDPLKFLETLE